MIKIFIINFFLFGSLLSYAQLNETKTIRVLFIGNSIVEENNLAFIFNTICKTNKINCKTGKITFPAATIYQQIYKKPTINKDGYLILKSLQPGEHSPAVNMILKEHWDVIFLQGSTVDSSNLIAIAGFDSLCKLNNIPNLFYLNPYCTILFDSKFRKELLKKWDALIFPVQKNKNCKLIQSGHLFDISNDLYPHLELYPDNCHPSFSGSVIIAASIFKELFARIPDITCFEKQLPKDGTKIIGKVLKIYYEE